jgi:hypothetical protein
MPPLGTPDVPANLRQQLQILVALSKDRLNEVHFRYAMELVDHARHDVDAERALSIYTRLHAMRGAEAENLYQKVFVALGRRHAPKPFASNEGEDGPKVDTPQSVLGLIRRRLRGRTNLELRQWVEYHTGRAETELLWAHVENALRFVELLDGVIELGDAVSLYATELTVSPTRTEMVYHFVLAHLSGGSPASTLGDMSSGDHLSRIAPEPAHRSLRIGASRRVRRPPQAS